MGQFLLRILRSGISNHNVVLFLSISSILYECLSSFSNSYDDIVIVNLVALFHQGRFVSYWESLTRKMTTLHVQSYQGDHSAIEPKYFCPTLFVELLVVSTFKQDRVEISSPKR
jgi:hypothetical protein